MAELREDEVRDVKCILLDIEGTICPISFVKDTLFPYAVTALPNVLKQEWDAETFRPFRDAFPEDHRQSPEALLAHVQDLTARDVKAPYFKALQGYLWEHGYETGEYSTPLFPDVVPKLRQWIQEGRQIAIYSSGSVFAQKLLFGHVQSTASAGTKRSREDSVDGAESEEQQRTTKRASTRVTEQTASSETDADGGERPKLDQIPESASENNAQRGSDETEDLCHLISNWFDTTNAGLKTETASYTKIAEVMKISPAAILFLTDNMNEVKAALGAGMGAVPIIRPGNAPVSEEDEESFGAVQSFDDIRLQVASAKGETGLLLTPDASTSAADCGDGDQ